MAGDQQAAAYWAGREQAFQEILHRANRAALEYLQAWAGITRTGYHGTRVDGREPGRFEPAGLIVTSWLQGTSRDGDPQDHIHNQIARITRTFRDGKWRALDTMSVRAVLGALQAVAATTVECELTREFGVDVDPARGRARQRDPRRHAGADGRVFHAHRAGAREGTRTRAGVGAQARPRADLARAAAHRQRRHAPVTQGQGRGPRSTGTRWPRRWDATLGGELAGHRASGVERARPGRTGGRASRRPGADRTAYARGPGPGAGQGPGPGVGPASGLDPARPAQAARPGHAAGDPAHEPGGSPASCCSAWPRRPCPAGPARWCAWRPRNGRRCPRRCAASWTGAASTRGPASRGTPPPRS